MSDESWKGILGLTQSFLGSMKTASGFEAQASSIIQGGEIAAQGAQMTADSYRQSAQMVQMASIFNSQVDKFNTFQQIQSVGRNAQRAFGLQTAQIAQAGLSQTSKSALMLRNEAMDVFTKQISNIKIDARNKQEARRFETESRMVNLENQARAAEYQGAVERVNAQNRASQAQYQADQATFGGIKNIISKAPTLLGNIFGG